MQPYIVKVKIKEDTDKFPFTLFKGCRGFSVPFCSRAADEWICCKILPLIGLMKIVMKVIRKGRGLVIQDNENVIEWEEGELYSKGWR